MLERSRGFHICLLTMALASFFALPANAVVTEKHTPEQQALASEARLRLVVNLVPADTRQGRLMANGSESSLWIARLQDEFLQRLKLQKLDVQDVTRYQFTAQLALSIPQGALSVLEADPAVVAVNVDSFLQGSTGESVPMIFPSYRTSEYSGADWAVVILDTGVDKFHSAFGDRVVEEACYSSNAGFRNYVSLCPGSTPDEPIRETTATGSGVDCQAQVDNLKSLLGIENVRGTGCSHGTGVAGIAAGNFGDAQGVARDASIIAMQISTGVISKNGTPDDPSDDVLSVGSFSSDILKALQRVYALKDTYNIAAVNLSLNGLDQPSASAPNTEAACSSATDGNGQGFSETLRPIIQQLRNAGIATVVSTGNNDIETGVNGYACIEEVIAVGATDSNDEKYDFCDHDMQPLIHESPGIEGFALDPRTLPTRRCGSNSGELLDLWAPGVGIRTARAESAGGGTESNSGTSEAAPHVAGAWAVMRQRQPDASVDEIEAAFDVTGKPITVGGVTRSRINIDAALEQLGGSGNAAPVAQSPSGEIDTNMPVFNWTAVAGSRRYALYARDAAGELKVWKVVGAARAGCASGSGTCSYTHPQVEFSEGTGGFWKVMTVDDGYGPESNTLQFTVNSGGPVSDGIPDACAQGQPVLGNSALVAGEVYCLEDTANGRQRQMEIYVSGEHVGGTLEILLSHGRGNGDLLHRSTGRPTATEYEQLSNLPGNDEFIVVNNLTRGWHYIHVRANPEFAGASLQVRYR